MYLLLISLIVENESIGITLQHRIVPAGFRPFNKWLEIYTDSSYRPGSEIYLSMKSIFAVNSS